MNSQKKLLTISFLVVILTFISCSPIVRLIYGVKKPKVENEESLKKYLEKVNITDKDVYTLDFEGYKKALELINKKIPEVLIFDKNGKYIPYGDEWACNASAFDFIENLNDTTEYISSEKANLKSLPFGLYSLKGDSLGSPKLDASFHIFIFWAKFAGKLNKNHVKVWENQAYKNTKTSIRVYKVNMDFQEHWGEEVTRQLESK